MRLLQIISISNSCAALILATAMPTVSAGSSHLFDSTIRHRRLSKNKGGKAKSGKGNKICLVEGELFDISGSEDPVEGPTGIVGDQFKACVFDSDTNTSGPCLSDTLENCQICLTLNNASSQCQEKFYDNLQCDVSLLCDPYEEGGTYDMYVDCLDDAGFYDAPFWFNRDVGPTTLFSFIELPNGKGAIKGEIPENADGSDKVIVEYWSDDSDLWNLRVDQLEYIKYDFFPEACPGTQTECAGEFYISIYTRESGAQTAFYDCRINYAKGTAVTTGTGAVGEWTTLLIDFTDPDLAPIRSTARNAGCPSHISGDKSGSEADTPYDLGVANYVLGTGGTATGYIFALNMGDSVAGDNGLIGYFGEVQIKLVDEDAVRVYNFKP
ncbi:hypothetical protein ACHAXS_005872 [Conticribra weissflogii]